LNPADSHYAIKNLLCEHWLLSHLLTDLQGYINS
jgi:hypothetical protein